MPELTLEGVSSSPQVNAMDLVFWMLTSCEYQFVEAVLALRFFREVTHSSVSADALEV